LVQQVVAEQIRELLGPASARVTVTRVDASPDLRNATIWIGLLWSPDQATTVWEALSQIRGELQSSLAGRLTTKFVPRLALKLDTGGAYAAQIDTLLKSL
jgi:ribosome-binding factor A